MAGIWYEKNPFPHISVSHLGLSRYQVMTDGQRELR